MLVSQRMGSTMEAMALGQVGEVDGAEFVGGLVVVLVQAEAGDGVGDDALRARAMLSERWKKFCAGVGIVDEVGAVFG